MYVGQSSMKEEQNKNMIDKYLDITYKANSLFQGTDGSKNPWE